MTNGSNDRLDRIEELLQQSIVDSNTRFIQLEQLAQSNSRTIQAMLDAQASDRLQRAELQTVVAGINETIQRLTTINEGVVNLLSSLDSDRN